MADQQSFIVTARKWRPLKFSDVVGQEHITTTLKNAIKSDRIHHAYLFTGPRGVGKTTCARILARAVNCLNAVDFEPCNKCQTCTDMLEGRSVDIIEIDGASNNSVDDVRKLRDNAKYAPMSGRYKMYIIDEVHMLSTAAFNALLKTLEEPPALLIFVFATTEIHKVPATILSRCQRYDFRRMEIDTIVQQLQHIAESEAISIDDGSLVAVAKKADGSMRDAQSIFDQVVAFCGMTIRYADVSMALHLIDLDFYFGLSEAVRQHDVQRMFDMARQVIGRGYDLQECLIGLLEHFRNILSVIATKGAQLIDASQSDRERYLAEATLFTKADVVRIMTLISQGEAILRQNPPQPRIRFEFTLVQLATMDSTVELSDLLKRLGTENASLGPGSPSRPFDRSAPATTVRADSPSPAPTARADSPSPAPLSVSSLSAANIAVRWDAFLETLPETLVFIRGVSKQAGMLTIEFTDVGVLLRPHADVVYYQLEGRIATLKSHLKQFFGVPLGVQLFPVNATTTEASHSDVPGSPPKISEDLLPVERSLVELFHARRMVSRG